MVALLSGTLLFGGATLRTGLGTLLSCLDLFALQQRFLPLSSKFWIPDPAMPRPLPHHWPGQGIVSPTWAQQPPPTYLCGRALGIISDTPTLPALTPWPSMGSLEAPLDLLLVVSPPVSCCHSRPVSLLQPLWPFLCCSHVQVHTPVLRAFTLPALPPATESPSHSHTIFQFPAQYHPVKL